MAGDLGVVSCELGLHSFAFLVGFDGWWCWCCRFGDFGGVLGWLLWLFAFVDIFAVATWVGVLVVFWSV